MIAKWYIWSGIIIYVIVGIAELVALGSEQKPGPAKPKTRKQLAIGLVLTVTMLAFAVSALFSLPEA